MFSEYNYKHKLINNIKPKSKNIIHHTPGGIFNTNSDNNQLIKLFRISWHTRGYLKKKESKS